MCAHAHMYMYKKQRERLAQRMGVKEKLSDKKMIKGQRSYFHFWNYGGLEPKRAKERERIKYKHHFLNAIWQKYKQSKKCAEVKNRMPMTFLKDNQIPKPALGSLETSDPDPPFWLHGYRSYIQSYIRDLTGELCKNLDPKSE